MGKQIESLLTHFKQVMGKYTHPGTERGGMVRGLSIKKADGLPDVCNIAGRFEYTNPVLTEVLGLMKAADFEGYVQWFFTNTRDDVSPLQQFLRRYYMSGIHYERSVNRFALSVELVSRYCRSGGVWFDAGSMGHDALRVAEIRPDVEVRLASLEGCIIYRDERGLHYWPGSGPVPSSHVYSAAVDFERSALPCDDGSVDLLTCFETLEHFKFGPQLFMKEASRVLKLDAPLIITTPNACSAAALWQLLCGGHPAECALYHADLAAGRVHPLEYARVQLSDLLTDYGFEVEVLASVNLTPFDESESCAIRMARDFAQRYFSGAVQEFGHKWLAVARKRKEVRTFQYPSSVFG
jgi:hypothetical protein